MSMRNIALAAVAVLFTVSFVQAHQSAPPTAPQSAPATITGTWTGTLKGSVDGESKAEERALMILKQDGAVLTGTAGPSTNEQWAIAKGKVSTTKEGTVVTFELANDSGMLMLFDLKLVQGKLTGVAKAEREGKKLTAVIDLERSK